MKKKRKRESRREKRTGTYKQNDKRSRPLVWWLTDQPTAGVLRCFSNSQLWGVDKAKKNENETRGNGDQGQFDSSREKGLEEEFVGGEGQTVEVRFQI